MGDIEVQHQPWPRMTVGTVQPNITPLSATEHTHVTGNVLCRENHGCLHCYHASCSRSAHQSTEFARMCIYFRLPSTLVPVPCQLLRPGADVLGPGSKDDGLS